MKRAKLKAMLAYLLILSIVGSALAYNKMTERRLNSVHTVIKEKFSNIEKQIEKKFPQYEYEVISGYRTKEHQDWLYRNGKTPAKGGNSFHNYGLAIDVVPFKNGKPVWNDNYFWKEHAKIVRDNGLNSGYFWRKRDSPHVDVSNKYSIKQAKKDYANGGFREVFLNVKAIMGNGKSDKSYNAENSNKPRKNKNCVCD